MAGKDEKLPEVDDVDEGGKSRSHELLWSNIPPKSKASFYTTKKHPKLEKGWNDKRLEIFPLHKQWTLTKKTKGNFWNQISTFILNLEKNIDIFKKEVGFEETVVGDHSDHSGRVNMVFYSWSALLDLMHTFLIPNITHKKGSFFRTFNKVIIYAVENYLVYKKGAVKDKDHFLNKDNSFFKTLSLYRKVLNNISTSVTIETKKKIEQLAIEQLYHGVRVVLVQKKVKDTDVTLFKDIGRNVFNLSKDVVSSKKERDEEVRGLGADKPINVPYANITAFVRMLWDGILKEKKSDVVWGDFEIDNVSKCAHAFCLLELCSGSRSHGIVAMNRIDHYLHVLENDKKLTKEKSKPEMMSIEDTGEVQKLYAESLGNIIVVDNLSKTKTATAGAMSTFVRIEGKFPDLRDKKTLDKIDEIKEEQRQKQVIKPILYDYFDPNVVYPGKKITMSTSLLKKHSVDEKGTVIEGKPIPNFQTEVFLRLLVSCRQYTFEKYKGDHCVGKMGELYYILNKDKCRELSPPLHQKIVKMKTAMRDIIQPEHLRKVFPSSSTVPDMFSYGKKTHQLRKIYVAVAYLFYTDQSMKEISFAKYVLGHETMNVSLNYMNVKIIKSVEQSDFCTWLLKDSLNSKEQLSFLVDQLKDRLLERPSGDDRVQFLDNKGHTVWIEKIKRSKRHRSVAEQEESRKNRIYEAIDMLRSNDVHVSTFTVRMLGVQVSKDELPGKKEEDETVKKEEEDKKSEKKTSV